MTSEAILNYAKLVMSKVCFVSSCKAGTSGEDYLLYCVSTGVVKIIVRPLKQVVCIDVSRGFNTVNAKLSAAAGLSDKIIIPGERYGSTSAKKGGVGRGGSCSCSFGSPAFLGRKYRSSTTSSSLTYASPSLLFLSHLYHLLSLSPSLSSVPCYPARRNRMTSSLPTWFGCTKYEVRGQQTTVSRTLSSRPPPLPCFCCAR